MNFGAARNERKALLPGDGNELSNFNPGSAFVALEEFLYRHWGGILPFLCLKFLGL